MRISYTQVTTYQRCPHKYQLAYVQRVPVAEPGVFLLGSAVHGALRFMHQPGNRALPPVDAVIAEFCRIWRGGEEQIAEHDRTPNFEAGVEMLQQHYAREAARSDGRLTADVERNFNIPFGEGHLINGRIDRVDVLGDGSIEVTDYKTGRRMPAQADVDRDLQLAIYRLAAQEVLYPEKTVLTSLYYLRHGQVFTAHPSDVQLEAAREAIREVIDGVERKDFGPRVEPSCDWCEVHEHCMVFRPVVVPEVERKGIEGLINELAETEAAYFTSKHQADALNQRRAELAEAILTWLKDAGTGSYTTGNLQAFANVQRKSSYLPEAVRPILEPLGLWEKVCKYTVTKATIDSLVRAGVITPAVMGRLRRSLEVTEKPYVKLRRLAAGEDGDEDGE